MGLWFLFFTPCAFAAFNDRDQWSFSLLFGIHRPRLTDMNQGLFKAPLIGQGGIIIDPATEQSELRDFRFNEPLPSKPYGGKAAVELQWHPNAKQTLVLGLGSWERTAISTELGSMPTEGTMNEVNFERRAKISYSEYYIGWRYTMWSYVNLRVYTRISAHEIFDISYREDEIFHYISGSGLAGFQRITVLEAKTAALFMGQFAAGGEWYFQPWFSLGFELGYFIGPRDAQLSHAEFKTDFLSRDNVRLSGMPYGIMPDRRLGYLAPESTAAAPVYKPMKLDFSGLQTFLRFNFYY
jgi:hypothetical protein